MKKIFIIETRKIMKNILITSALCLLKVKPLVLLFFGIFVNNSILSQILPTENQKYWNQKFYDEFDGNILDGTKWAKTFTWHMNSNIHEEFGWDIAYRRFEDDNNVKISNGTLKLITKKENYMGNVWTWPNGIWTNTPLPFKYTTGMLYSKQMFRYGYYEIKFKLPFCTQGFGPNFWMYHRNDDCNWGEIDIFEISSTNNLFTTNVHYQKDTNSFYYTGTGSHGTISNNVWHTAGLLWTPNNIIFYLDGVQIREYPNHPSLLPMMPLIIDINSPAANFSQNFIPSTIFPYVYEVDYVRVWQLKPMNINENYQLCSFPLTNPNPASIPYAITIGNGTCNVSLNAGQKSHLMVCGEFTINKNVTIENGAELIIEATPYYQQ